MIKYILLKIKPGKRQVWLDWCHEIMNKRYNEAIMTLAEENLVHELCLIFDNGDESYVVYKHETVEGKEKKTWNTKKEINVTHYKKFHECLEKISEGVVGYDLDIHVI